MSKDTTKNEVGIQTDYRNVPSETEQLLRQSLAQDYVKQSENNKPLLKEFKDKFKSFGFDNSLKFDWFLDQVLQQKYVQTATPIQDLLLDTNPEDVIDIWKTNIDSIDQSYNEYAKEYSKQIELSKTNSLNELDKMINSDPNQKWLKYNTKFDKNGKLKFELQPVNPQMLDEGGVIDVLFDQDLDEQHYMMETFIKTVDNDFSDSKSKELRNKDFKALKFIYEEKYNEFQKKKPEVQDKIKQNYADAHFKNAAIFDQKRPENIWKKFAPTMMPGWKGIERIVGKLLPDDQRTTPEAGKLNDVFNSSAMLAVDELNVKFNKTPFALQWAQTQKYAQPFSPAWNLEVSEMAVEALPNSLYFLGELALGAGIATGVGKLASVSKLPKVAKFFDNAGKVFTATSKASAKAPLFGKGAGVYWADVASRAGKGYVIGSLGSIPRQIYEQSNEMYDKSKPRVAEFLYRALTPGLEGLSETVFILPKLGASNIAKAGQKILGSNITEIVLGEVAEEEITGIVDDIYQKLTTGELGETSLMGQAVAGDFNLKLQVTTMVTSLLQGGMMSAYSEGMKRKYSKELMKALPEVADYLLRFSDSGSKIVGSVSDKIKKNFDQTDILQSHLMSEEGKGVYYAYTVGMKALQDEMFDETEYNIADYGNNNVAKAIAVGIDILKNDLYENNPEVYEQLSNLDTNLESIFNLNSVQIDTISNELKSSIISSNQERVDSLTDKMNSIFTLLEVPEQNQETLKNIFLDKILFNAMLPNSLDDVVDTSFTDENQTTYVKNRLNEMLDHFVMEDKEQAQGLAESYKTTAKESLEKAQKRLNRLSKQSSIDEQLSEIKDIESEIEIYTQYQDAVESLYTSDIRNPEVAKQVTRKHFISHYRKQLKSMYSDGVKSGKYDKAFIKTMQDKFLGLDFAGKKIFQSNLSYDSLTSFYILKNIVDKFTKERFSEDSVMMSQDLTDYYMKAVQLLEGLSSLYGIETDYVEDTRNSLDSLKLKAFSNYYKSNPDEVRFRKFTYVLEYHTKFKIKVPFQQFYNDLDELTLEQLIDKYPKIPHKMLQFGKERIDLLNGVITETQKTKKKEQKREVTKPKDIKKETVAKTEEDNLYEDEVTNPYVKDEILLSLFEEIDSKEFDKYRENYDIVGFVNNVENVTLIDKEGNIKPEKPFILLVPKTKENYKHGLDNKFKLLLSFFTDPLLNKILVAYKSSLEGNYVLNTELINEIKNYDDPVFLLNQMDVIFRYLFMDYNPDKKNKHSEYYGLYEGKEYKVKSNGWLWKSPFSSPLFGTNRPSVDGKPTGMPYNGSGFIGSVGVWFIEAFEKAGVFERAEQKYQVYKNQTLLGKYLETKDVLELEKELKENYKETPDIDSNAPISPVEPQTPEEAMVIPIQELSYEGEGNLPNLKFYKGSITDDPLFEEKVILVKEINPNEKGNVLDNPTRFVEEYFDTNGIKAEKKLLDVKITQPALFTIKNGVATLISKGKAEYVYDGDAPQEEKDTFTMIQDRLREANRVIDERERSKRFYTDSDLLTQYKSNKISKEEVINRISNDGFKGDKPDNNLKVLRAVLNEGHSYDLVNESEIDVNELSKDEQKKVKLSKLEVLKLKLQDIEQDDEDINLSETGDFTDVNSLLGDKPLVENYELVMGILNETIGLNDISEMKFTSDFMTKLRILFWKMQEQGNKEVWSKKQSFSLRSLFMIGLKKINHIVIPNGDRPFVLFEEELLEGISSGKIKINLEKFSLKQFEKDNRDYPNIQHLSRGIKKTYDLMYADIYRDQTTKAISLTLPYKSLPEKYFSKNKKVREFVELVRMINNLYQPFYSDNEVLDIFSEKLLDATGELEGALKDKVFRNTLQKWFVEEVLSEIQYKSPKQYNLLVGIYAYLFNVKESIEDVKDSELMPILSKFEDAGIPIKNSLEGVSTIEQLKAYLDLYMKSEQPILGYYDSKAKEIILYPNWTSNPFVLVHEILHSITLDTIGSDEQFTEIRKYLKGKVEDTYIENNSEMISYLYSDVAFIKSLMSISYKKIDTEETSNSIYDEILKLLVSRITEDEIQQGTMLLSLHNHFKNWLSRAEKPPTIGNDDNEFSFMRLSDEKIQSITKIATGYSEERIKSKVPYISKYAVNLNPEVYQDIIEESLIEAEETLVNTIFEIEDTIDGDVLVDITGLNEILKEISVYLSDINWKIQSPYEFFGKMGIDQFMEFFDKEKIELKKNDPKYSILLNLYETFNRITENDFKKAKVDRTISKSEYRERIAKDLYSKLASKENYVNYEIALEQLTEKQREQISSEQETPIELVDKYSIRVVKLGINSRNSEGQKMNTMMPVMDIDTHIRVSLEQLFNTIGNFGIRLETQYIRSFFGKQFNRVDQTKWGQTLISKTGKSFKSLSLYVSTLMNHNGGLIFLNKFGDKSIFPVYKLSSTVDKSEIQRLLEAENIKPDEASLKTYLYFKYILPMYITYRQMGKDNYVQQGMDENEALSLFYDIEDMETNENGKKKPGKSYAQIWSIVTRILVEELKLGNKVENLIPNEQGTIKTMLYGRNMIQLMKRATPVAEHRHLEISETQIRENNKWGVEFTDLDNVEDVMIDDSKHSSIIFNKNKVYFRTAFINTKNLSDLPIEVQEEIKSFFYNLYGTFRFDGADFVIRNEFDDFFAWASGQLNTGVSKNIILFKNLYMKHATHSIPNDTFLAKWMKEHKVAYLVFDINEKNDVLLDHNNGVTEQSLLKDNQGQNIPYAEQQIGFFKNPIGSLYESEEGYPKGIATYYLPIDSIHRIGEKYNNKTDVKGIQQIFFSSGLSFANKVLGSKATSIMKIVNEYIHLSAMHFNAITTNDDKNSGWKAQLARYVAKQISDGVGTLNADLQKIFPEIPKMYSKEKYNIYLMKTIKNFSADQIVEYLKTFLSNEALMKVVRRFMDPVLSSYAKLEDSGRQLTLSVDIGSTSQMRTNEIKDSIKKSFIPDNADEQWIEDNKESLDKKVEEFYNEATDKKGFLKRDYCYITIETAEALGIGIGDRVLATIVPSASLMECKGLIIAGILTDKTSNLNSIILNHEYAQSLGRDYDIDVIQLLTLSHITLKQSNDLIDAFMEIEKDYINLIADLFKKLNIDTTTQKEDYISRYGKEAFDSLGKIDKNIVLYFNNTAFVQYQQQYLGKQEGYKPYYHPAEKLVWKLADNYQKDVGRIIVMRTLHTTLSNLQLKFKFTLSNDNVVKVDFANQTDFFANHISQMIGTQHQVDYPKDTSKDTYNNTALHYFAKMLSPNINFDKLTQADWDKIEKLYNFFSSLTDRFRLSSLKETNSKNKLEVFRDRIEQYYTLEKDIKRELKDLVTDIEIKPEVEFPYNSLVKSINRNSLSKITDFIEYSPHESHLINKIVEAKFLEFYLINGELPFMRRIDLKYFRNNLLTFLKYALSQSYKIDDSFSEFQKLGGAILQGGRFTLEKTEEYPLFLLSSTAYENLYQDFGILQLFEHPNLNEKIYTSAISGEVKIPPLISRIGVDDISPEMVYLQTTFMNSLRQDYITRMMNNVISEMQKSGLLSKEVSQQRGKLAEYYGIPKNLLNRLIELKQIDFPHDLTIKELSKDKELNVVVQEKFGMSVEEALKKKYSKPYNYLLENYFNYDRTQEFRNNFDVAKTLTNDNGLPFGFKNKEDYKKFLKANAQPELSFYLHLFGFKLGTSLKKFELENSKTHDNLPLDWYIFDKGFISYEDVFTTLLLQGFRQFGYASTSTGESSQLSSSIQGVMGDKFNKIMTIVTMLNTYLTGKTEFVLNKDEEGTFKVDDFLHSRIEKLSQTSNFYQQYFADLSISIMTNVATQYNNYKSKVKLSQDIGKTKFTLEIQDNDGKNVYRLFKNKMLIEEEEQTISLNGKIHNLIKQPEFWTSNNRSALFNGVKNIIRFENMSLHDRKKLFNRVFKTFLTQMGLFVDGKITKEGTDILDTAFGLMIGIPERTPTIAHNLYIKGVTINNNLLLSVMGNWSKDTLFMYKLHVMRNLGTQQARSEIMSGLSEGQYAIESSSLKRRKEKLKKFESEKTQHPMIFFGQQSLISGLALRREANNIPEDQLADEVKKLAIEVKEKNLDLLSPELGELTDNVDKYINDLDFIDTTVSDLVDEPLTGRVKTDRLKRIYIDLKEILKTHEEQKKVPKTLFTRIHGKGKLLLALARKYGRLDLTINDTPEDNLLVYRAWNNKGIKGLAKAEEDDIEEMKNQHYLMKPLPMRIISKDTNPYNSKVAGLRPFTLMEAFWSKVDELNTMMREELKVIHEQLDGIDNLTNISSSQEELNLIKLSINKNKRFKLQSSALILAEELSRSVMVRGNKVTFSQGNVEQKFNISTFEGFESFFDFYFPQNKLQGDIYTREEYMLVAYQALALRRLFDNDLKNLIDKVYSFMQVVKTDFEGTGIYEKQIDDLHKKYQILFSRFKPQLRNSRMNVNRVTPKVFNSKDVLTFYVDQMISVRWDNIMSYLEEHEKWLAKNEDQDKEWIQSTIDIAEKLRDLPVNERYDALAGMMQDEIKKRIGQFEFYVPMFSKIEDNHLTKGYIPSIGMIKTHVFDRLVDMMERDINTVYYYQFKTRAIQTKLEDSQTQAVTNWFSDFINAIDIDKQVTPSNLVNKGDIVYFYYDDLVSPDYILLSGEVVSVNDDSLTIESNGERRSIPHNQMNISKLDNKPMEEGFVYLTTSTWQKSTERRILREGFKFNRYLPSTLIYYAVTGLKSLYTQSTIGSIFSPVTAFFNFAGGMVENFVYFQSFKKGLTNLSPEDKIQWEQSLKAFTTFGNLSSSMDYNAAENDLVTFSTATALYRDLGNFMKFYRKTEYYQVTKDKLESLHNQIKALNRKLTSIDRTSEKGIAESRMIRQNVRNLWKQIGRLEGLIEYQFSRNSIYENMSKDNIKKLEEEVAPILEEYDRTGNIPFVFTITPKTLAKTFALLVFRKSSSTVRRVIQSPEAHLRHTGAMGMWYLASNSGVTDKEALYAWAKRGITLSQRIYNQHARKINKTGFMDKFSDLLGQYSYISYINFLQSLDEIKYQSLSVGTVNYLKETLLHNLSRLGYPSIQVMLSDINGYNTRSVRQNKEGEPVFENALAKVLRQLMGVMFLVNLNGIIGGFARMANPAFMGLYQIIIFLFKWLDDDPETKAEVKDLIYIFNLYMQLHFGMGSSLLYNMPVNYVTGGNEVGFDFDDPEKTEALLKGVSPRLISKYGNGVTDMLFGSPKVEEFMVTKADALNFINEKSKQLGFFNLKSIQWYDDPQYLQIMKKELEYDDNKYAQFAKALLIPGQVDKKSEDQMLKMKVKDLYEKGFISTEKMLEFKKYSDDFKFREVSPLTEIFNLK